MIFEGNIEPDRPAEHSPEYILNQEAFRELRDFIRDNYPSGRFVGIAGGKIVADAARFEDLDSLLDEMGFTSPDVMVVEAGVEYPYMDILHCESIATHQENDCSPARRIGGL